MPVAREWPVDLIRQRIEIEGLTHQAVAEELGCAAQTIGKLCAKHGIRCHKRGPRPGPGHPNWQGGRQIDKHGYVLLWVEGHPHTKGRPGKARANGYVREHRLVMEQHLGRYLKPGEVVHHINGDKQDNRIENLHLFSSNAEHLREELTGRVPNWTPEGRERILAAVSGPRKKPQERGASPAEGAEP